ncbi:amino acid adenylation domain-containing protein [Bordetella sp. H567]|uniref:amino acid adenylation domain-containing protein n=1 Tax=Bordetella sp. H567 TaxID=1697043 RepID=UPI001314FFEF|nr:amino acid adenylation domain-containing protein [Bordetella sp. H567]
MSFPLDHFDLASRALPAHPAIRQGHQACSYAELRIASDRVAARLHALGAGPGTMVGIALDRSIEWVVAMLGILKCGAAYLPLDPSYPEDRLALYIADSQARYVIGDSEHRGFGAPETLAIEVLAAPSAAGDEPSILAGTAADGGHPAYLLYTSGSTGRPKGVVVSRDALAYHMNWFIREFACSAEDVFLHKTPTAFDASVWEYLAPLMVGATMVIADNTPQAIAHAARQHGATLLQAVPAMLHALAEPAALRDLASLRLLFSGGEPLPRPLVRRIQAHLPIPVVNLYGPTEATVQCAFHICTPGDTDTRDPVPLGRPLPGTTFHIDAADGTDGAGELIIDGPGVASGYHGQPGLTAARFGASDTGGRTYRSGDRVRRDAQGDYVFLGRTDNQVKLRGLRIELEEIEHALARSTPALRGAVAIVNDAQQIEVFLDIDAADWDEAAARQAMASALPGFMQPLVYTRLARFPVLPNGKRDRAAVRALSTARAVPAAPPDATQAPGAATADAVSGTRDAAAHDVAARVRAAWSGLLPHGSGDDSHFFRAGGHSLLAMQLIATVNRDFDLQLSASALFAQPTLGALIRMVEAAVHDAGTRPLPMAAARLGGPAGAQPVWFVHPAGGGIWCYRDIAESAQAMESYGIACEPLDDGGAYETDLRRMARRYAEHVLARQPDGPLVLCGYSFGGNVAYEMAVHLQSQGKVPALLVLLDTYISRPTGADTLDFIASYARKLVNGGAQAPTRNALAAMPVGQRNVLLRDMGIRGGHLPADATLRDVEQGLAMWIANNQAAETHTPRDAFEGQSLFIRCTGNTRDSLQGWPALLKWLHVQDVPADHYTVYRQPVAASVAVLIEAAIQRSTQRTAHAMA